MFEIIATIVLWAGILLFSELLWRMKIIKGEYARKAVHILISLSIAFTPYYLSWQQIQLLGTIGLAGAIGVRLSGLFKGAYDIKRKSLGDIFGPAAILAVAFMEPHPALFMAVMLHTGVADGVAAIVGTSYGEGNSYKVLGYTKSVAGTAGFFATSLLATAGLIAFGGIGSFGELWPLLIILPLATTIIENIGVYGVDNVLITLVTVAIFSRFI